MRESKEMTKQVPRHSCTLHGKGHSSTEKMDTVVVLRECALFHALGQCLGTEILLDLCNVLCVSYTELF